MLGCMQEEYENYDILEFCSGGAKQYGMPLKNKKTGEMKYLLKIRVIANNFKFNF